MSNTPYSIAAADYQKEGWSPIPLPAREKFPVPDGVTGAEGRDVDELTLRRWAAGEPITVKNYTFTAGNIALRMPRNVVGIDVDAYGDKKGGQTLAEKIAQWGPLPSTWVSTSRPGTGSGIRFFRIPKGLAWPGQVGPGIEIVRWDHRYALVMPSLHPEGRMYIWVNPSGLVTEDEFPSIADLPKLPKAWVEGLTGGAKWEAHSYQDMDPTAMQRWLSDRVAPDVQCKTMQATTRSYLNRLRLAGDDGGIHDVARDGAWAVLGDSAAGHGGVIAALSKLRNAFMEAVKRRGQNLRQAKGEWARLVQRGMGKVAAEGEPDHIDPCIEFASATKVRIGDGSGAASIELTEQGNAARLAEVCEGRLLWVEDIEDWRLWNPDSGMWGPDIDRQRERWAVKAANIIDQYASDETMDPAVRKTFRAHFKASEKIGGLRATLEMLKGRPGHVTLSPTFDADPYSIAAGKWLLHLERDGSVRRTLLARDDRVTFNTGLDWVPDAVSTRWEEFLERFLPDPEVREWLQRIVGRSLLGNVDAERIMVVLMGKTSTGKSTFANMISRALGDYGGPMPQSVLRAESDDRPRPDLLAAMRRRVVVAEEFSAEHNLHVDQIKRITGGTAISARGMRSNTYVERVPDFTPWLVTNETPHIQGADDALRRRVLVVPFEVQLKSEEELDHYGEDLWQSSGSAILNWAVQGYTKYVTGTKLQDIPAGALAATTTFHASTSDFSEFVAERLDRGADFYEPRIRFYEAYQSWCFETGVKPMTMTAFGRRLTGIGIETGKRSVDGKQIDVRCGARLVGA